MIDLWTGVGIVVFVAIVIWWDVTHPGPTPGDADSLPAFTKKDPRCARLAKRQREAREFMDDNSIKRLLTGKPAWQRINPMHIAEGPTKVTKLRRKS